MKGDATARSDPAGGNHRMARRPSTLTPRQAEVVALVVEGRSNKEIATALGISLDSARYGVKTTLRTLGLHTRTSLAVWSLRGDRPGRYLARFAPLPEPRRGHSDECGCSVCFVRQERRQAA